MNKAAKFAELMGWSHKVASNGLCYGYIPSDGIFGREINPYADTMNGRSQFAAILLKMGNPTEGWESIPVGWWTQENILDEILIMIGSGDG